MMQNRMIRVTALLSALIMLFLFSACGAEDTASVDIGALTRQMQDAAELPGMLSIRTGDEKAERGFAAISDLGYDRIEEFDLLYAADGTAYELAVIRLKDAADMPALKDSLERHIAQRVQQYRQYDASQVPRAEGAVVAVHGACAALIMCDDNTAVKRIFDAAFA